MKRTLIICLFFTSFLVACVTPVSVTVAEPSSVVESTLTPSVEPTPTIILTPTPTFVPTPTVDLSNIDYMIRFKDARKFLPDGLNIQETPESIHFWWEGLEYQITCGKDMGNGLAQWGINTDEYASTIGAPISVLFSPIEYEDLWIEMDIFLEFPHILRLIFEPLSCRLVVAENQTRTLSDEGVFNTYFEARTHPHASRRLIIDPNGNTQPSLLDHAIIDLDGEEDWCWIYRELYYDKPFETIAYDYRELGEAAYVLDRARGDKCPTLIKLN